MRNVLENSCALILYRACLTCGTAAADYRCYLAPSEPASSARRKSSGTCMESPGARTAMGAAVHAGGAPAGHAKMRHSWYFRRRESCAKTCAKHAHMQHKLRTDAAPDDGCVCGHSSALAVAVLQPSRLYACRLHILVEARSDLHMHSGLSFDRCRSSWSGRRRCPRQARRRSVLHLGELRCRDRDRQSASHGGRQGEHVATSCLS